MGLPLLTVKCCFKKKTEVHDSLTKSHSHIVMFHTCRSVEIDFARETHAIRVGNEWDSFRTAIKKF